MSTCPRCGQALPPAPVVAPQPGVYVDRYDGSRFMVRSVEHGKSWYEVTGMREFEADGWLPWSASSLRCYRPATTAEILLIGAGRYTAGMTNPKEND